MFIGNCWLTLRACMIYRTIWAIYRHGAVAMSALAFWLLPNLTLHVCMAPDSCVIVSEAFIFIWKNWKAMFGMCSNVWNELKAEIQSDKEKQTSWKMAVMTVWQPFGPICCLLKMSVSLSVSLLSVLPTHMCLRKINRTDLMWQTWINMSHRSLKMHFVCFS